MQCARKLDYLVAVLAVEVDHVALGTRLQRAADIFMGARTEVCCERFDELMCLPIEGEQAYATELESVSHVDREA